MLLVLTLIIIIIIIIIVIIIIFVVLLLLFFPIMYIIDIVKRGSAYKHLLLLQPFQSYNENVTCLL